MTNRLEDAKNVTLKVAFQDALALHYSWSPSKLPDVVMPFLWSTHCPVLSEVSLHSGMRFGTSPFHCLQKCVVTCGWNQTTSASANMHAFIMGWILLGWCKTGSTYQ